MSFDLPSYLAALDPRLLATADGRKAITRINPLLFALIYLPHHLRGRETGDVISFSQFQLDLYAEAKSWLAPIGMPREGRSAWLAPREAGKSTTGFLCLPMWAAAHRHISFIAAFAHKGEQAELHLQTFKRELDENVKLRYDYPELCSPARRPRSVQVADNRAMLYAHSGFVFAARGMDSASLGLKVGQRRPELLLLDDIEKDESSYSLYQKEQRLRTLQDAILPLNSYARVLMLGTTTMFGAIMHDVVLQVTDPPNCPEWVGEEKIVAHHYPAIVTLDDGTEVSLWPERWPLAFLQEIRHTRAYAKNFANQPVSAEGDYWSPEDFRYDTPEGITRRILSIDPAVTSRATSDYTGLAVIGYSPSEQRCVLELARQVKMTPGNLRGEMLRILSDDPRIKAVYIETNQGGDAWGEILSPLPPGVKIITLHNSEAKTLRASRALEFYQAGRVVHAGRQAAFEDQAVAFPNVANDDVVDAVCSGVLFFLRVLKKPRVQPGSVAYA